MKKWSEEVSEKGIYSDKESEKIGERGFGKEIKSKVIQKSENVESESRV